MQSLTLCLIVRNEELLLPDCLASVWGVVDRIVVVDTGSSDRSVAIAEAAGAEVLHHTWADDFAAARNAALEAVAEGYVLVLDADERLAPCGGAVLRRAVEQGRIDCGLLPLHNADSLAARAEEVLSGARRHQEPVLLGRLFRRTPDLRWEGIVHEQVTTWLKQGRHIERIEAPIIHYGMVPDLRETRGKDRRNLSLLERRAVLEPNNPTVKSYLCRELIRQGEEQRALGVADDAWECIRRSREDDGIKPDVVSPASLRAFLLIKLGRLEDALQTLEEAVRWEGNHPNLDLLEGICQEQGWLASDRRSPDSEDLLAAERRYRHCLARSGEWFLAELLPGATGWAAAVRLGTVRLLQGAHDDALRCFDSALAEVPDHAEARCGRVEALLGAGEIAGAIREVEPLLALEQVDGWVLAALAGYEHGGLQAVAPIMEQALRLSRERPNFAPHRLDRLLDLVRRSRGETDQACAVASRSAAAEALPAPRPSRPVDAPESVSVVVPVYNRLELVRPVLKAFLQQREVTPFELILVDDGSLPSLAALLEELGSPAEVRLLRHETNRGRGPALNTGFEAARGEIIIVCDGDIVPEPGFVSEHVAFHRQHPAPEATHTGALVWGVEPWLYGELIGARSNPHLPPVGPLDWRLWFTDNWSFKRRLLTESGIRFDPGFHAWGWEELDFGRRLQAAGATNTLTALARGRHLKPTSLESGLESFRKSVPNFLHLAALGAPDTAVEEWSYSRFECAEALECHRRAVLRLWGRLEELNLAAEPGGGLCTPRDAFVSELSLHVSNAVYRLGMGRGFLEVEASRSLEPLPLAAPSDARQVHDLAALVALVLVAEERHAFSPDTADIRRHVVQDLELEQVQARDFVERVGSLGDRYRESLAGQAAAAP